ncbi:MAG: RNB domain-containing ribonuclease, partial [Pseudomonadales bacterium]|nr:RNB domain-containing ribonuclease [Pseudomonadales bacterium]
NDDGSVDNIVPRQRNDAHRLIEECMLCANVSAARFISRHGIKGLYRVHEGPDPEQVEYLTEFLSRFGILLSGDAIPSPSDYQMVIDQLRGRKNGHVLQVALLRSLTQAVYQPENKGHFGLNYKEYAHFTSPIRRYPDLLTHRLIKSVIHSRKRDKTVERFGASVRKNWYPYDDERVLALGEHCSFAERRAETAVYDVLEWIKCDYISDRVGDLHDGVITGVTKFGCFVELEDIYVEGLIHVSTLEGDYFEYDPGSQCLTGKRSRRAYGLGDSVRVQIARVNVDERKIDFELVSHSPLKSRQVPGKKKSRKESAKRPSKRKTAQDKRRKSKRQKSKRQRKR